MNTFFTRKYLLLAAVFIVLLASTLCAAQQPEVPAGLPAAQEIDVDDNAIVNQEEVQALVAQAGATGVQVTKFVSALSTVSEKNKGNLATLGKLLEEQKKKIDGLVVKLLTERDAITQKKMRQMQWEIALVQAELAAAVGKFEPSMLSKLSGKAVEGASKLLVKPLEWTMAIVYLGGVLYAIKFFGGLPVLKEFYQSTGKLFAEAATDAVVHGAAGATQGALNGITVKVKDALTGHESPIVAVTTLGAASAGIYRLSTIAPVAATAGRMAAAGNWIAHGVAMGTVSLVNFMLVRRGFLNFGRLGL